MSQEIIRYNIDRWDAVVPVGQTIPAPMVYVKPDNLLKNKQGSQVAVKIENTGNTYDGLMTTATVYTSGEFPNLRPNFFEQTGLYVLLLDMPWLRYPSANGTIDVLVDKVEPIETKESYVFPKKKKSPCMKIEDEEEETTGMDSSQIGLILICIVSIFIVLYWISIDGKVNMKQLSQ